MGMGGSSRTIQWASRTSLAQWHRSLKVTLVEAVAPQLDAFRTVQLLLDAITARHSFAHTYLFNYDCVYMYIYIYIHIYMVYMTLMLHSWLWSYDHTFAAWHDGMSATFSNSLRPSRSFFPLRRAAFGLSRTESRDPRDSTVKICQVIKQES